MVGFTGKSICTREKNRHMNRSLSVTPYGVEGIFAKVPEITIYFWIIKLLTTAMGEATSDWLVFHMNPYIAVTMSGIVLIASLIIQLSVRRYIAWIYWAVVVMVSIFGTMVADSAHIVLGIPYLVTTIFYAVSLTLVFVVWYRVEKTLSIHSIYTRQREIFYWASVLVTFALGTALGDMTATTLHLGYFISGVLFAALFAVPAVCSRLFGMNEILTFWFAYVITRPLGASFADWFGMPRNFGGLGFGRGVVSIILTGLIVTFVGYLSVSRIDVRGQRAEAGKVVNRIAS